MTNILHLTDLHLDDGQFSNDDKKNLILKEEKETRFEIYKRSINKFLNSLGTDKLDAIVVSGDITIRNQERGFELFNELIKSLDSTKLPPKNRIVVVPGNHDVDWFVQPSGYVFKCMMAFD